MLLARIKISNINYEKTFRAIFPLVKEKVAAMESKNMMIRLFQKLDDAALPVLLGVMCRLPEKTKNELLVHCINTYAIILRDKLNEELKNDTWGRLFLVGDMRLVCQDNDFFLGIDKIEVDYKSLLEIDAVNEKLNGFFGKFAGVVKTGTKMAVTLAPDALEKKGLEILWKEENKQKLMAIAKRTLDMYGIVMSLDDIQLMQDKEETTDAVGGEMHLNLTGKMEEDLLDALAGYLIRKIDEVN